MKNINEAFSPEESKEIYDKFVAIVNTRRDNLVKKYGKEAERVAYASAVNQVKKKATEEPTIEEPMDQEQKLKEMIQAALSKPLSEKKKSSSFTSQYDDKFDDKRKNLPDGLQKAILKKQGELDEDLDLGHTDDEPHMLKADLYRIGKYAMELYKMVDQFEGEQEVDFPHWWQAKIIQAKSCLVSAKHYLDFEIKEPQIDAIVDVAAQEEVIDEKLKPSMGAGAYVKDFKKSDAPQFKGKSKKKKQKMAVAAYLSAKDKIKEIIKEKLNFVLGSTIHGDPNKPMENDFKIAFKDPRNAIMVINKVNDNLKSRGLEPIDYENIGVIFNNPSNQQMQFILDAFNDSDIESIGRMLQESEGEYAKIEKEIADLKLKGKTLKDPEMVKLVKRRAELEKSKK